MQHAHFASPAVFVPFVARDDITASQGRPRRRRAPRTRNSRTPCGKCGRRRGACKFRNRSSCALMNRTSFVAAEIRMPYRRTENVVRRLAARRDAIVAAACEIAAESGMAGVQIAPVSARAGIATGTVYRYFPSKTDLVAALVTAVTEREIAALEAAANAAPGPLSALAAAL